MPKKKKPLEQTPVAHDVLPFPFRESGQGFTRAQVVTTVEYLLAVPGWVPSGHAMELIDELIDLADELDSEIGDESEAAWYALFALRLISTYKLQIVAPAPAVVSRTYIVPKAFAVVLENLGPNKINVIKTVREVTGLGLKEAKNLAEAAAADGYDTPIKADISEDEAEAIVKKLTDLGAQARVYSSPN